MICDSLDISLVLNNSLYTRETSLKSVTEAKTPLFTEKDVSLSVALQSKSKGE